MQLNRRRYALSESELVQSKASQPAASADRTPPLLSKWVLAVRAAAERHRYGYRQKSVEKRVLLKYTHTYQRRYVYE